MRELDAHDKALLNRIQSNFPLTPRPFETIAAGLGLDESEVIERVRRLKRIGIIRRIGANFVPAKLGFVSTLCAACVPTERLDAFAAVVNRYPGVTHNYQRECRFNVWFTFIAPSMQRIETHLRVIARQTGVDAIMNLPAVRVFKISAHFDL